MESFLEDRVVRHAGTLDKVVVSALLSISLLVVILLGWGIIDGSLSLMSFPILLASLSILLPTLSFVSVPYTIPTKSFTYKEEDQETISIYSRLGAPLVAGISLSSVFLAVYGFQVVSRVSPYGYYYIVAGLVGIISSAYFVTKWMGTCTFGITKVTLSQGCISTTSLNTVIEFPDGRFEINYKQSSSRPRIIVSGMASIYTSNGDVSESIKSVTLSPINCGRLSMDWIADTLENVNEEN